MDKKKVAFLPPLSETLLKPDGNNPQEIHMELDEGASFVFKKAVVVQTSRMLLPRATDDVRKPCRMW